MWPGGTNPFCAQPKGIFGFFRGFCAQGMFAKISGVSGIAGVKAVSREVA